MGCLVISIFTTKTGSGKGGGTKSPLSLRWVLCVYARISRNLSLSELWCPLRVLMPIPQQNLVLSDGVKDFCSNDQWHKNKTEICLCDSVQTQQKSLANCGQTQHAKARSQNLEMILGVSVCSPNLLSFTPDVKASMSECNTMRRH